MVESPSVWPQPQHYEIQLKRNLDKQQVAWPHGMNRQALRTSMAVGLAWAKISGSDKSWQAVVMFTADRPVSEPLASQESQQQYQNEPWHSA